MRDALHVFEKVMKETPAGDRRHRFEHLMLAEPTLFDRLAQAGVGASFHIQHVHYYGRLLRDKILGTDRAERMFPLRTAMLAGIAPSLHSDHPMFPSTPMALIQTAVTRRTQEGDLLGFDQTISVADALHAMTLNPARQVHAEHHKGSIVVGKFSDLVLLSRKPFDVRPEEFGRVRVDQTWVGGVMVWDRNGD